MKNRNPISRAYTWQRLALALLVTSVITFAAGCSLFRFEGLQDDKARDVALPEIEPCQQELDDKRLEILKAFKDGQAAEKALHILQSTDPECDNREALYFYTLRLGRHDMDLLLNMAYALYRGTIFSFRDEFGIWKHDVHEKDMVDRLLYGLWRRQRLYRYNRITFMEYSAAVREVTDFFAWFVANVLPDARNAALAGSDLTEIEVPELRLLTHSFATFMDYFGRYADHEILGNMRNVEFMRSRFMELIMTDEDECEAVSSLRMSGLRILQLDAGFILQTALDVTQEVPARPTSTYAFVRNPKTGEMLDRVLVIVPSDRNDSFREWGADNSYFLKPVRVQQGYSRLLEARFSEREDREEDPARKVFRMLGKIKEEPPPLVARMRFVEPEVYRMVGYVETPILKDLFETCGAPSGSLLRVPDRGNP